jgi:hypothetical protein
VLAKAGAQVGLTRFKIQAGPMAAPVIGYEAVFIQ